MKKTVRSLLLCSSLVAALSACSEKKENTDKVTLTVNQQMAADELTEAGEQLLSPTTFHLADRAFTLALEKNPSDKKAQFYHILLKRFMVFRGIIPRIDGMVKENSTAEKYAEFKESFNNGNADFVTKPIPGAKVVKTVEDVQNVLIEYREALQDFRKFVKQNPDLQLNLNLNPYVFQETIQNRMMDNCQIVSGSTDEDAKVECSYKDASTVRVNIADLMALKQEAAGEILYLTLYTSYGFNGVIEASKAVEAQPGLSSKESLNLTVEKMDLRLLNKQGMTAIREIMTDFGVAAKWAMKYQSSLCPKDKDGRSVGRKAFMFTEGLCIEDATALEKSLGLLEQGLRGAMKIDVGTEEKPATKDINFMALFDKPVKNLRSLLPAEWNNDGSGATSFKDKTLGGLLPNADADDLLNMNTTKPTKAAR
ncbi:MAG: hypothetical protein ACKOX6_06210 [Bdellovibrio sp.]